MGFVGGSLGEVAKGGGVSRLVGSTSIAETDRRVSSITLVIFAPSPLVVGRVGCTYASFSSFSLSKSRCKGTIGSLRLWLWEYPFGLPFRYAAGGRTADGGEILGRC